MEWIKRVKEFDNTCAYCGESPEEGELLEIEHLIPLSRGGYHRLENVVPACPSCNKRKGSMTYEEFLEKDRNEDVQADAGQRAGVDGGSNIDNDEIAGQAGD